MRVTHSKFTKTTQIFFLNGRGGAGAPVLDRPLNGSGKVNELMFNKGGHCGVLDRVAA